jgi:hypothetical protein
MFISMSQPDQNLEEQVFDSVSVLSMASVNTGLC